MNPIESEQKIQQETQIQPPKPTVNPQHYMMFVMLLEAALRHREAYWRESISDYRAELEYGNQLYFEEHQRKRQQDPVNHRPIDRGWKRRTEAKVNDMVENFTKSIEAFNRSAYAIIENLTNTYSEESRKTFENHATAFSIMCGEMNIATITKDPAELLVLAKMYNAGQMDNVFHEYRAIQNKKSEEPPIEIETKQGDIKLVEVDAQRKDPLIQKIHPFPGKH